MSDFCYQCTAEVFGEEYADRNDFGYRAGDVGEEELHVLCEGCGWTVVDNRGRCVNKEHAHQ